MVLVQATRVRRDVWTWLLRVSLKLRALISTLLNFASSAFIIDSLWRPIAFKNQTLDHQKPSQIPDHLALIMDGNRRWARLRGWHSQEGHLAGFRKLQEVLEWCFELKIRTVTVYAFSVENFKRPPAEVDGLMELFKVKLRELCGERESIRKHQVAVRIVGDLSLLPADTLKAAREAMELTKDFKQFTLNICCPYTSRHEMQQAAGKLLKQRQVFFTKKTDDTSRDALCDPGRTEMRSFDVEYMSRFLLDLPPLDLLIRTSGESRLSDFMLWQCSDQRCKMYFVDSLWPDLNRKQFMSILFDSIR